jgi:hypothetical protein
MFAVGKQLTGRELTFREPEAAYPLSSSSLR